VNAGAPLSVFSEMPVYGKWGDFFMGLKIVTAFLSFLTGLLLVGICDELRIYEFYVGVSFFFGIFLIWWVYLLVDKMVKKQVIFREVRTC